jgi:hypothetical protein
MAGNTQWTPLPTQVVSDLGQLAAFGDPDLSRILRVLQVRQATASELARMLDLPASGMGTLLQRLVDLALIRVLESNASDGEDDPQYRATARMFNLKPEPRDAQVVTPPVAGAILHTITNEILTSAETWPDQAMAYEGRRARIPPIRAVEFNDRLVELLREFWGDDVEGVEEDPDSPMLSFVGVWYRVPD